MWSTAEVKKTGMLYAKKNYWPCVLASAILTVCTGGGFSFSYGFGKNNAFSEISEDMSLSHVLVPIIAILVVIFSFAFLFSVATNIFAKNPLACGCYEFSHRNLFSNPSLFNILNGFRVKYWNKVRTLFLRDLYVFLWSLLFFVPGIVKSYSYRLVPYIISENPDITTDEALKLSDAMMKGNKGAAFGYDLSFIGWHLLVGLTLGVLGVFYVFPYKVSSDAVLYERIKQGYNARINIDQI